MHSEDTWESFHHFGLPSCPFLRHMGKGATTGGGSVGQTLDRATHPSRAREGLLPEACHFP